MKKIMFILSSVLALASCGGTASVKSTYSVTFKNYDLSVLYETEVQPGGEAFYEGETPLKPSTDNKISYIFSGWDKQLVNIQEDCSRIAQFREEYNYTKGLSFEYSEAFDSYLVKSYIGSSTEILIPQQYAGKPVYAIAQGVFYNSSITSIELPESLLEIGNACFQSSRLVSIDIPEGVTKIGEYMFANCPSFISATFPSTLKTFAWASAFLESPNVESISISADNAYFQIIDNVAYSKDGKTLLYCPSNIDASSLLIPNEVTSIGAGAFHSNRKLSSIVFPSSLSSIGGNAFYGCSALTSIDLPSNLSSINQNPFAECIHLSSITVDVTNASFKAVDNVIFNKSDTSLICYPAGKTSENYVIPNSIVTLSARAFEGSRYLEYVIIPASVTTIGNNCFASCSNALIFFESTTLPSSLGSYWNYPAIPYYLYSENQPSQTNVYWHYVEGNPTIWAL
ncbi:MAG: leucine-rich repeat domain-containing protein [Bacilli bacterium]|jgi:hypothetical protein